MRIRSLLWLICLAPVTSLASEISLYALFQDKAILHIDGARRVVTVGSECPEGVKLISTDTDAEEAVVEMGGKRQTLKLGVVISAFDSVARESVMLYSDNRGFFHADGMINKTPVRFLVDTGANTVAMNTALAKRCGINLASARPGVAKTASGFARVYNVKLDSIRIGDIVVYNVEAGIIDGPQPDTPLLGMSFLSSLEMKREGDHMELKKRF